MAHAFRGWPRAPEWEAGGVIWGSAVSPPSPAASFRSQWEYVPHVRIRVDPRLKVPVERQALETILVNLISNAVRYGAPPITVTARVGDHIVLTVDDQGRGVSQAFERRLFEPFARSEPSRHDSAGLGLGLAIARLTAEDQGARLTHEYTPRGARFQLVLAADELPSARQPLAWLGKRLLRDRAVHPVDPPAGGVGSAFSGVSPHG